MSYGIVGGKSSVIGWSVGCGAVSICEFVTRGVGGSEIVGEESWVCVGCVFCGVVAGGGGVLFLSRHFVHVLCGWQCMLRQFLPLHVSQTTVQSMCVGSWHMLHWMMSLSSFVFACLGGLVVHWSQVVPVWQSVHVGWLHVSHVRIAPLSIGP